MLKELLGEGTEPAQQATRLRAPNLEEEAKSNLHRPRRIVQIESLLQVDTLRLHGAERGRIRVVVNGAVVCMVEHVDCFNPGFQIAVRFTRDIELLQERSIGEEAARVPEIRKNERSIAESVIWRGHESCRVENSLSDRVDKASV